MRPWAVGLAVGLLAGAAGAQTMVEAVVITGAAAGKVKGLSGAVSSVLGQVGVTLAGAAGSTSRAAASPAPSAAAEVATAVPAARVEPPRPKPSRTELESVEKGTRREELLAKLGPPEFRLTRSEGGRLEEVLDYTARDGSPARVRLADGKVLAVDWPGAK